MLVELKERFEEEQRKLNEEKDKITSDAIDQAFMLLLGIPCKVMNEQYGWKQKRLEKLCNFILEYYNEFQNGDMSIEAYRKLIWEQVGIGFTIKEDEESTESVVERYEQEMSEITE